VIGVVCTQRPLVSGISFLKTARQPFEAYGLPLDLEGVFKKDIPDTVGL